MTAGPHESFICMYEMRDETTFYKQWEIKSCDSVL